MAKLKTRGGSDYSPDMQKVFDYLKKLLADGKKLDLSLDEIKKKAKVPNAKNANISSLIIREKEKGNFKNLTVKKFAKGAEVGKSKYDTYYKNSKKFRDFYDENYETPWNEADRTRTNIKANSYNAFLRKQKLEKAAKGFTLTGEEMAKKLGLPLQTLRSYESKPNENTSTRFIRDNIEKKRTVGVNPTTGRRETVVRYKDPGVNVLKNWNALISSPKISSAMVDNIKEYDKLFRKKLKDTKKLPDIGEVLQKTSMSTPTTIANTEALYSRLLRGETFRTDVNIAKDAVLGKKIINELGINSTNNARRSAFYNLALDNVNKLYPQASGTLGDFKDAFRAELKKTLGLKKGQTVPFSVNEVISLSAGESRSIQPFSVFVDAVETTVNENELRNYQGQFSKKVKIIDRLLSAKNPDTVEAKRIAGLLDANRTSLINQLTERGFTTGQINQLNLPDIKVGKTIDPKIYSPATLKRYKEAGLDIGQFAKDRGFYVDVKKAKPFWESNIRNTIISAAQNNTGNVCNIFAGKVAFSKDGGRIGFSGGCADEMAQAMETDRVGTLNKINQTEGILPKFKNAATSFLRNPSIRTFGVGAAVGTAVGLVKAFRNDDPTTYLSNEDQQKNMLVDMATQPVSLDIERPAILDYQLPAFGAALAGTTALAAPSTIKASKSRSAGIEKSKRLGGPRPGLAKTGLRVLGRGLGAAASPALLAPFAAGDIASQIAEGDTPEDIATDPLNYLYPVFADKTPKLTRGLPSAFRKVATLGLSKPALRLLSRAGIGGFAASAAIQGLGLLDD